MGKYLGKYLIESKRAKFWDYRHNAAYFITVCSRDKIPFFGKIENRRAILSEIGEAVKSCWNDISNHFPYAKGREFIIMPDHFHGIITINKSSSQSLPFNKNKFGPQSNNLASIVRGFKVGVTKEARKINPEFSWQPGYHDRIIFNENEYKSIVEYIFNNPLRYNR